MAIFNRVSTTQSGIENIKIDYYESGDLPAGSIAVLKDGRRLLTEEAYIKLIKEAHIARFLKSFMGVKP